MYARAYAFADRVSDRWEPVARKLDTIAEAEVTAKGAQITSPAVGLASQKTGVREVIMEPRKGVDEEAIHLVAILPNQSPTKIQAIRFANNTELAERLLVLLQAPIQTADEFRNLSQTFRSTAWIGLHQWVVIGGQSVGDKEDPDDWAGYLELCLRFSTFADR